MVLLRPIRMLYISENLIAQTLPIDPMFVANVFVSIDTFPWNQYFKLLAMKYLGNNIKFHMFINIVARRYFTCLWTVILMHMSKIASLFFCQLNDPFWHNN